MTSVQFDVVGEPKPQGSKSAFVNRKTGRAIVVDAGDASSRQNLKAWRAAVAEKAREAAAGGFGCIAGPVQVDVFFRLPMPASRPKRFRLFGRWKIEAPDSDKLARSLGDSLTESGLIEDDAKIVVWRIAKIEVWQAWIGATVRVTSLDLIPTFKRWSTPDYATAVQEPLAAGLEL